MVQIHFKGKTLVRKRHLLAKCHELLPVKEKSPSDGVSLQDNLIIHGDNITALKAILSLFAGKVKCTCIDPPVSTGNRNWR